MTSPKFPEPPAAAFHSGGSAPTPGPTPLSQIDEKLDRLAARKDAWLEVGIPQRIEYMRRCMAGMREVSEKWVADGCRAKGIALDEPVAGEEWVAGIAPTLRNLRLFIEALEQGGQPKPPSVRTRADGQVIAQVFPTNLQDRALFTGFSAEVWMEPGQAATQGAIYRDKPKAGKVSLVLGAGNVSSIPPMDAIYKLIVEDEVVILKMNPVNEWSGPHLERAFKSLIDDGFLAVVYGGAEQGAYLAEHAKVDTLHVTGSDRTYDAIVWGTDPADVARRKAANEPKNSKPFTAELGCVTPVLVVPGPWSDGDLDFQARQVAGMVAQNASFNCNAAKVLVLAKGWPQRAAFLAKVREHMAAARPRKAYYPGAKARYQAFIDKYPQAEALGQKGDAIVPWTLIPNVTPTAGEYALTSEAFCGVLAQVDLDATDAADFLDKAVDFANDGCWGTLSCTMLIHPKSERELGPRFEDALARLRFGGIGVNAWSAVLYALVVTTWGAFPGHPKTDIRSGAGVVHNSFMFDHPQKSIVKAPFRIAPTPVWFADHKTLLEAGKRLAAFEGEPGWGKVISLATAALRG